MICALCKEEKEGKKNTHYLTDAIIRTCLNQNGSNGTAEGFYFDISNDSAFTDFNFQRQTSQLKLEDALGRTPTDEESKKARQVPYSVDNVFCKPCEDIFTSIETPFTQKILPKFRNSDLSGLEFMNFSESRIVKLFFYLQVWRSSICEDFLNLGESTSETLRNTIFNWNKIPNEEIPNFPIHITYLQTTGGAEAYTSNFIGFTTDENPYIIFMNDFVIQFFETLYSVNKIEFYGLNDSDDFNELINLDNDNFKVKILSNFLRLKLLNTIADKELSKQKVKHYVECFIKIWHLNFRTFPSEKLIQQYLDFITSGGFDILKYSEAMIIKKTSEYIIKVTRMR